MSVLALLPREIDGSKFVSSTIAEPDTASGEVAWNPATNYSAGNEVVLAATHRVYTCVTGGVDARSPDVAADKWGEDTRPSNRWAWADNYTSTASTSTSALGFTVQPGSITAVALYGLVGESVRIQVKDAPGGATIFDTTYALDDYFGGDLMWEWYFGETRQRTQLIVTNIYPHPLCEVTVTVNPLGGAAACGLARFGSLEDLGIPEAGFVVSPVDYSRIKEDEFGNVTVKKGRTAKNISGSCVISAALANAAAETLNRLLGVPTVVIVSLLPKFDYMSAFGLVSAEITADGPNRARLSLKVKGFI